MKMWLILLAALIVGYLYGWRVRPQEIPNYIPFLKGKSAYKSPILYQDKSQNVIGRWRPQDLLDNFNGNREYNAERARISQQAEEAPTPVKKKH